MFNRYKKMKFGKYFIYYNKVGKEQVKVNETIKKNMSIKGIGNNIINIEVNNLYEIIRYELKKITNVYTFHKNKTIEEILEINDEELREVISYIQEIINQAIKKQEQNISNKFNELSNLIKNINLESI